MLNVFSNIKPEFSNVFINPIHLDGNEYINNLYKEIEDKKKIGIRSRNLIKYYFKYYSKLDTSIVHWHWFQSNTISQLIINIWVLICLYIYKISGANIVWTIHNLHPHSNKFKCCNKIFVASLIVLLIKFSKII